MTNHRSAFIWALSLLAVLLVQFVATVLLGEPGRPGINPEIDIFSPSGYIGSFRPHLVAAYMLLIFMIVWVTDFLLSRKQASLVFRYLPILLVVAYATLLFLFISSDRIYLETEFKDGWGYIDPFHVFFIPFLFAVIFPFTPVFLISTVRRILKPPTNREKNG